MMESLSPFPLEQLAWGYAKDSEAKHILLYAAYKQRLKSEKYFEAEARHHIFPSFIGLCNTYYSETTVIFLWDGTALSSLTFGPGSNIPESIESLSLKKEENEETDSIPTVFEAKQSLGVTHHQDKKRFDKGLFVTQNKDRTSRADMMLFGLDYYADKTTLTPENKTFSFPLFALWPADIRDTETVRGEKKSMRYESLLWQSIIAAGIAAAVLLLVEGLLLTGQYFLHKQQIVIEEQTPAVTLTQQQEQQLYSIRQFSHDTLKAVDILRQINEIRPDSIYLTEVGGELPNQLTLEGVGQSISEVNRFTERLAENPHIKIIKSDPRTVTGGKTRFKIILNFNLLSSNASA